MFDKLLPVLGQRTASTVAIDDGTKLMDSGRTLYQWASELFPICRSITGQGLRDTLSYLQTQLPELVIHAVPSGTQVLDWTIPDEWNIQDAFIKDTQGNRIVDFQQSNLHVVGYSEPVDRELTFRELEPYLHYLPEQPRAIPYVTSYYQRRWGFCLSFEQYCDLANRPDDRYHAVVDSTLQPGALHYADLVLPGETSDEIFFSTYVCHPSMANNELSGPCVQLALARWIQECLPQRRFTYRFYFGPETIGAITYLSRHLNHLREHVRAGFVLTCLGDDRAYTHLASRLDDTLADRVARHVLQHRVDGHRSYSFLERGSDERQYGAPGVDLPVCTLSRSKFMDYPEYHTSLDDLDLISADSLNDSLNWCQAIVQSLEGNGIPRCQTVGEPQLGPRGLYPSLSTKETRQTVRQMMDLLAYSDGHRDLLEVAEVTKHYMGDLIPLVEQLQTAGVLRFEREQVV